MIKYSIITVGYKAEEWTQKCIESIAKYTKHYEHILVAQECDLNKFSKYPITIINNPKNVGLAKAVNQGLAIARGAYWIVTANDIEVKRNWIKPFIKAIDDGAAMSLSRIDMSIHAFDPDWIRKWGGYDEHIFFEQEDVEMVRRVNFTNDKCVEFEDMPFVHHLHKSGDLIEDRPRLVKKGHEYVDVKYAFGSIDLKNIYN